MQLLAIILYSAHGDRRIVSFKPGTLNVVTGDSATGKSSLLGIFEYCMGRSAFDLPAGPITDAVSWYAALFQLHNGGRAFVARRAPGPGRKTSAKAMLRLGLDQEPLEYEELRPELNIDAVREQLGRRIGIRENTYEDSAGRPVEANLGHATLLCLQGQAEIANKDLLFHRQAEPWIGKALKDTLPYFIGAVPQAQARNHAQLATARMQAQHAEDSYLTAREAEEATRRALGPLWEDARRLGMVPQDPPADSAASIDALRQAITADHDPKLMTGNPQAEQRTSSLRHQCTELRDQLRAVVADRRILLDQSTAAESYAASLTIPTDRLTSLNLLGLTSDQRQNPLAEREAAICVLCGSDLPEADPTSAALSRSLDHLSRQLSAVASVPAKSRQALEELDARAQELRDQLLAAEGALETLISEQNLTERLSQRGHIDFIRGRIHGVLSTLPATSRDDMNQLQGLREAAAERVASLEAELSPATRQRELNDRLVAIGQDLTAMAHRFGLEHADQVFLDPDRLTLSFGSPDSGLTLSRLGSGQNWVGYHVLAHLALHRYFVQHNRPVPRILWLDQPTQAWYSDGGAQQAKADQEAVRRLFELIESVVQEMTPNFQIIVVDHVDLPDPWFQAAVGHKWRGGQEKLVPLEWLDRTD
ncbi:DUF3732 domain-containing protein [Streptomyces sp. NPDC087228]|uniref:DUF3732 domain-containing protein n=1 Tax=Streptomyces sp. NPDC087228 TaxID=3365772 RepID=UPI003817D999